MKPAIAGSGMTGFFILLEELADLQSVDFREHEIQDHKIRFELGPF